MNKKVLITGGAGFIGSHLVNKLNLENADVVVLDSLNPQIHANPESSYSYQSIKNKCSFILGDVRNSKDWENALNGIEIIVHLAAETGTGQSMYESSRYVEANCMGTAALADLLNNTNHSVQKVIVASSRSIYGEGKYQCEEHGIIFPENRSEVHLAKGIFDCCCPICEAPMSVLPTDESSRINPLSVYGLTKYFQENMLQNVCAALGIGFAALRFQNVYGPGQSLSNPYTGIISIFSNRIRQNKGVFIFEDGLESRDFVYVDDVVKAILLAMRENPSKHNIFNVGSGKMTTVLEIAETLREIINPGVEIKITGQYRKGDIRHNFADLSISRKELSFDPKTEIKSGLNQFVNWMLSQEIATDGYEKSLKELQDKGLLNK